MKRFVLMLAAVMAVVCGRAQESDDDFIFRIDLTVTGHEDVLVTGGVSYKANQEAIKRVKVSTTTPFIGKVEMAGIRYRNPADDYKWNGMDISTDPLYKDIKYYAGIIVSIEDGRFYFPGSDLVDVYVNGQLLEDKGLKYDFFAEGKQMMVMVELPHNAPKTITGDVHLTVMNHDKALSKGMTEGAVQEALWENVRVETTTEGAEIDPDQKTTVQALLYKHPVYGTFWGIGDGDKQVDPQKEYFVEILTKYQYGYQFGDAENLNVFVNGELLTDDRFEVGSETRNLRFYLPLPMNDSSQTTPVEIIENEAADSRAATLHRAYNLNGQSVGDGYKGIVVRNGKKVYVK